MPNIVGISAYFHDSACCLLKDGILVAAAEEERFSRRKHDSSLPRMAFLYCLAEGGMTISDIDCIAYYEDPYKKLGRQIYMMMPDPSPEEVSRAWQNAQRPIRQIREALGYEGPIKIVDHHYSHAASSFFFSGFSEAAVLTMDGVGEWATTSYGCAHEKEIKIFEEVDFPNSIGLLYSTLTSYLGFSVNEGEYKVMGLAPYGKPIYVDKIHQLLKSQHRGQYKLNLDYFDFKRWDRMFTDALPELLGQPPRQTDAQISTFHMDIARSLQVVLEEILLAKTRYLYQKTGSENLCLAGGVALNCVANSRIRNEGPFKQLFVQPAAGDAGSCLGAAALAHTQLTGVRPEMGRLEQVYLGPAFSSDQVARLIDETAITAQDFRGEETRLLAAIADRLAAGKVIGWFQGRMEFGPRALGARSILADPRDPTMRDRINALVKKREGFRPFAPAVLESKASLHFNIDHASPFMLETCQVRSTLPLPAITHVDNSARIQTVAEKMNSRFSRLLKTFEERTGCPILLNTSFNMRDEPIVCTPFDAILCFIKSEIDTLVIEDFIIDSSDLGPLKSVSSSFAASLTAPTAVSDMVYTFI
jgi:carbamoyltransferase